MEKEPSIEDKTNKEKDSKGKLKALVIENDDILPGVLKVTMDVQGDFEPDFVTNTSGALTKLRQAKENGRTYGLVFSDLELTNDREGGLKITKVVKEEQLAQYLILYTGAKDKFEGISEKQLGGMGINALILKPVGAEVLMDELNKATVAIKTSQAPQ
jgi:hypothetical protein